MKKIYLIGAVVTFLLVLILALPQIGGTCQLYPPFSPSGNCSVALMASALVGSGLGMFLILFWKEEDDDMDEGGESGGGGE